MQAAELPDRWAYYTRADAVQAYISGQWGTQQELQSPPSANSRSSAGMSKQMPPGTGLATSRLQPKLGGKAGSNSNASDSAVAQQRPPTEVLSAAASCQDVAEELVLRLKQLYCQLGGGDGMIGTGSTAAGVSGPGSFSVFAGQDPEMLSDAAAELDQVMVWCLDAWQEQEQAVGGEQQTFEELQRLSYAPYALTKAAAIAGECNCRSGRAWC